MFKKPLFHDVFEIFYHFLKGKTMIFSGLSDFSPYAMISFELWKQAYILFGCRHIHFYKRKDSDLKKKELIFITSILAAALLLWGVMFLLRKGDYGSVRITVNGEEYGTYSLSQDQVISIGETNVCEIRDGQIKMTEADCPDHLCIKQKAVGSSGGTIVCLPNKVVIEGVKAAGSEDISSEFDTAV